MVNPVDVHLVNHISLLYVPSFPLCNVRVKLKDLNDDLLYYQYGAITIIRNTLGVVVVVMGQYHQMPQGGGGPGLAKMSRDVKGLVF